MGLSIDKEKVKKGLEHCTAMYGSYECQPKDGEDCPYVDEPNCKFTIMQDALTFMKEHEAVEPKVSSTEQRCGNCNKVIEMDGWIACPWCGKPIAWNEWWNKNGGQVVKLDD